MILSGSDEKTIRRWNAATSEEIGEPLWGRTSWVHTVALNPSGDMIVSGAYDNTIRRWNAV